MHEGGRKILSTKGFIYDALRQRSPYKLRAFLKRQPWFFPMLQSVFGNSAYSNGYYSDVQRLELESVPHIARWISAELAPHTIIDVGCGPGHLMVELEKVGIDVVGVDLSDDAERLVREKGLPFYRVDLTSCNRVHPGRFDLAISCEVAEHLRPQYAEKFVRQLTELSNLVYLTAAEPSPDGGTGLYHYNEQPNEYWIVLFEKEGYFLDESRTDSARAWLKSRNVISYLANPMIFKTGMQQVA